MQKITSLVQQLEEEHIEPIDEYLELKAEKKFVQDMQLYYTKHQGTQLEDKNVGEIIEVLLGWTNAKASQELIEIVQSYRPVTEEPVWKGLSQLITQLNATALEFEVKDILKRKTVKQERLLSLPVTQEQLSQEIYSEEVVIFLKQCLSLRGKVDKSLNVTL
jgi:hypothetical protein